jgi:hypothetical protein
MRKKTSASGCAAFGARDAIAFGARKAVAFGRPQGVAFAAPGQGGPIHRGLHKAVSAGVETALVSLS